MLCGGNLESQWGPVGFTFRFEVVFKPKIEMVGKGQWHSKRTGQRGVVITVGVKIRITYTNRGIQTVELQIMNATVFFTESTLANSALTPVPPSTYLKAPPPPTRA